jgi:L-2-hydroxyglutarate oxidase
MTFDVLIVGGGIVGMATAMAILRARPLSVLVLEKEPALGAHQTGRNSGVIHSGLYYKPGSLKATTCVRGREAMVAFCEEHGVPWERCGKIVVATRREQLTQLDELERRGRANGIAGMERLGPEALREREPHAAGIAALAVPETGIVDYAVVLRAMADLVTKRGGTVELGVQALAVHRETQGLVVETSAGPRRTRFLIGCAGLHSDRFTRASGVEPGVRIVPFRGEYFKLAQARESLVRNLIYPVPNPEFPFLGVHFTRMKRGGVEAGPNAVLALQREGYTKTSVSIRDISSIVTWGGFWRMGSKYYRTGLGELWRSWSKAAFAKALQELVPEICEADLESGGVGVRAQALTKSGALVDDFHIVQADRMVHVLNAPSPAATASIAIGEQIAERVLAQVRP